MKLSPTREMLRPYSDLILASLDVNQVATRVGAVAEFILMNHYGWLKNGDIGNEKGYDATDKDGNKHEIKGMSYETKTHYVAYKHSSKIDKYDYLSILHFNEKRVAHIPREEINKYDYLSILHFNEKRVAHIPREEINKFIEENKLPGRKTKSLRLCFNDPILTKLGKPRKKSLFLALFLKYEDKQFTF